MAALLLTCASAGCIAEEETKEKISLLYSESPQYIFSYVDEYTGVEYLIYDGCYNGGMCPRYNADGTLKINEEFRK